MRQTALNYIFFKLHRPIGVAPITELRTCIIKRYIQGMSRNVVK